MTDIADRKRDELRRKLQALPLELEHWAQESKPGKIYEKHNRQIQRLIPQMMQLHQPIAKEFESLTDDTKLLAEARRLEMRMLAAHTVWDYFRSKFVMRAQEPFASFLKAADTFAWACYDPVQRMYKGGNPDDHREPPLVALHNVWSPWALPRGRMYNVLFAPGGWTNSKPFIDIIQALPVPILGVPWVQLEHLPHVVMLAHEVGHVIEFDLNVQPLILEAITNSGVDEGRRAAWQAWETELFADWFGCYVAGPSFGWALAEVVADTVNTIVTEVKDGDWGVYPTTTLRLRFSQTVLRQLGWAKEADEIGKEWNAIYPSHEMVSFEGDMEKVADALFEAKLVPSSLKYDRQGEETVLRAILQATDGNTDLPDSILDPRGPIALAGALHREAPGSPAVREKWQRLRDHIVRVRPKGVLEGAALAAKVEDAEGIKPLVESFFKEIDSMEMPL